MLKKLFAGLTVFTLAAIVGVSLGRAVHGEVLSYVKIAEDVGGLGSVLDSGDYFGLAVTSIGDLNGDSVTDLAVGSPGDDDGEGGNGAVYVLFLEDDGSLHTGEVGDAPAVGYQKISDTAGEFEATFGTGMAFGSSIAALGDLNGDEIEDIAVGSPNWFGEGIVHILFLETNGQVSNDGVCACGYTQVSDLELGLGIFDSGDNFGSGLAAGHINDNGVIDLMIGADGDDTGGTDRGAVYIAFLTTAGAVSNATIIDSSDLTGALANEDAFGSSVAAIGDLNANDSTDIVVGAAGDDDGGSGRGAIYVIYMTSSGNVQAGEGADSAGFTKISNEEGGFTATLDDFDQFGISVANIGDLNEDGVNDLAVGANVDGDGGSANGAVYVLFMDAMGVLDGSSGTSEDGYSKISSLSENFTTPLDDDDFFGVSVGALGDLDGDGNIDLVAGANADDDGGAQQGAIYMIFMDGADAVTSTSPNPPSAFTFALADTGTCTWDPNIYLSVRGSNLQQVIVSDNLRFVGAQVLPYTPNNGSTVLPDHLSPVDNTMYIAFKLPSYATTVDPATGEQIEVPLYGPYSVYAVGRSGSGNITSIQTDSITFASSEDCTYPYEVILEEDTGDGSEEGNEGEGTTPEDQDPLIPVERHQIISLSANMNDLTNELYLVDTAADGTLVKRPDPRVTNYDISFSWLNKGYPFLSVNQRTLDSLPTAHAMLPEGPAILKFTEGSQNYFYIPSDNSAPREITTPNLANELFLGTPWTQSLWILGPEVPSSSVPHGRTIPRYDVAIVRDWRNNR